MATQVRPVQDTRAPALNHATRVAAEVPNTPQHVTSGVTEMISEGKSIVAPTQQEAATVARASPLARETGAICKFPGVSQPGSGNSIPLSLAGGQGGPGNPIRDAMPGTFSSAPWRQGGGNPPRRPAAPNTQEGPSPKKRQADPARAGEDLSRSQWEHYMETLKLIVRIKEKKRIIKETSEALEADSVQFHKMIDKFERELKSGHRHSEGAGHVVQGGGALPEKLSAASHRDANGSLGRSSGDSPDVRGEGEQGEAKDSTVGSLNGEASPPPPEGYVKGILKALWSVSDCSPEELSACSLASL